MAFYSFGFALFLVVSLCVYYIVPKRFQWLILLAANTVFYAFSGIGNLIFIAASAFITFFFAAKVSDLNTNLKSKKQELSKEDFKIEKNITQRKKTHSSCSYACFECWNSYLSKILENTCRFKNITAAPWYLLLYTFNYWLLYGYL
ncbi:hypothetical protein [Treponema sp. JC4]|uniref:hypothetical protein n=1 Tax=Treponema sp. JC4 TaxID=1124982 RepID=UPI00192C8B4E|nr:hypothetical protein [Treponema sp. JC4]